MKEIGTPKQVVTKKAQKTKKGQTYDDLIQIKKYATLNNRSGKAKSSSWSVHVKTFAEKNKLSYASALGDPRCSKSYTKQTPKIKVKKENSSSSAPVATSSKSVS